MKRYYVDEIPGRILGRTASNRRPLTLFWTGAGLVLNVRASELWVEIEADFSTYEPWLDVLIDGALSQRRMLEKGRQSICVFRGADPQMLREVRILRDTQAMQADEKTLLQLVSVSTDGSFEPVKEPKLKIEFIGDSITSGEGCCGALQEMSWIPAVFSCVDNYAAMTAKLLDAESYWISQSGWGVYCDWRGVRSCAIPSVYGQICGPCGGERNIALGAGAPWDFSCWQPDVVVINLGTNDDGCFGTIASGMDVCAPGEIQAEMRVDKEGNPLPADLQKIGDAAVEFLRQLRHCNKTARLLWVYGMLGNRLSPVLRAAVDRYCSETGDSKAEFMELENTLPGEFGSRQHPGRPSHEKNAKAIAAKIRSYHSGTEGDRAV